mmetsp:Transcript_3477/g.7052  ORF Transcript_3477/g.7052 Transcript_3477/m.7052 type:complete len:401 (-) Transcript_3477:216-1418(-)
MSGTPSRRSSSESTMDVYKSDEFRMNSMKIVQCSKKYTHDWTECPFAHPNEKATRRDPKKYSYTGIACPSMKDNGDCAFGDECPYAHNVFEYWLHPTRYRTQMCKDGKACNRKICFFAHDVAELRSPETKPFVSPEALQKAYQTMGAHNMPGLVHPDVFTPVRASTESVRQSRDWGNAPLSPQSPAAAAAIPEHYYSMSAPLVPQAGPDTRLDEKDVETCNKITAMLQEGKISADQAVLLLEQFLSDNGRTWLDETRGSILLKQAPLPRHVAPQKAHMSPETASLAQLAALQAIEMQMPFHDVHRSHLDNMRGSARSSLDMYGQHNADVYSSARRLSSPAGEGRVFSGAPFAGEGRFSGPPVGQRKDYWNVRADSQGSDESLEEGPVDIFSSALFFPSQT